MYKIQEMYQYHIFKPWLLLIHQVTEHWIFYSSTTEIRDTKKIYAYESNQTFRVIIQLV